MTLKSTVIGGGSLESTRPFCVDQKASNKVLHAFSVSVMPEMNHLLNLAVARGSSHLKFLVRVIEKYLSLTEVSQAAVSEFVSDERSEKAKGNGGFAGLSDSADQETARGYLVSVTKKIKSACDSLQKGAFERNVLETVLALITLFMSSVATTFHEQKTELVRFFQSNISNSVIAELELSDVGVED